ncbi:Uncharacterised protein [Vibrio cholerae]|nr:Uncharacterised protein [Vibrio cholerae]CSB83621.1 Uncharacterised protein [Vibrio cholerae]
MKFTRIVEVKNFTSVINATAQIINNLFQLVNMTTIRLSPSSTLNSIHASHVILTFTVRIVEPCLV